MVPHPHLRDLDSDLEYPGKSVPSHRPVLIAVVDNVRVVVAVGVAEVRVDHKAELGREAGRRVRMLRDMAGREEFGVEATMGESVAGVEGEGEGVGVGLESMWEVVD
jgi:hypothetical protein